MLLIAFILACFGATYILVYSTLFAAMRERFERLWNYLWEEYPWIQRNFPTKSPMECSLCVGFHVGWFILLCTSMSGFVTMPVTCLIDYFLAGCISAGTSYVLSMIAYRLENGKNP